MNFNRMHNTTRNIIWGYVNKIIMLGFPFIIRTIVIRLLGADYLGLSSLFASILQVLNLAELGFSSAVVYSLYKPIAENDNDTICALMLLYKKVYRIIGCIILAIGLLLIPLLPHLIKGPWPHDINLVVLYLIYLVNTSISYFLFAYWACLLNAHQRNDIENNVRTALLIVQFSLQVLILFVTKNYYLYIVVQPIITAMTNAVTALVAKKLYPQYMCRGKLTSELVEGLKKRISGLMTIRVMQTTRNTFDSIAISAFIGLTAVTVYSNYYYILNGVRAMLLVLTTAMQASVGNSVAVDEMGKNYKDMKRFTFLYAWLAGWCTVCMFCLYQPVMLLWMGKDLLFDTPIVIVFCIYFYLLSTGDIPTVYENASGIWWAYRKRAVCEAVANLILNFFFVWKMGVLGVLLATVLTKIFIGFIWGTKILFDKYFNTQDIVPYYVSHIKYAVVTAIACISTYGICVFIPTINAYLHLLLCTGICMTFPNLIFWMIYRKFKLYPEAIALLSHIISHTKE